MTNNENWQGNSRRSNTGAGRDGNNFERRDSRPYNKVYNKGAGKFNGQTRNDDSRPYESSKLEFRKKSEVSSDGNRDGGQQRPRFNPNRFDPNEEGNRFTVRKPNFNGDRPAQEGGNRFQERPRRNDSGNRFNNNRDNGQGRENSWNNRSQDRPSWNNQDRPSGDRPNRFSQDRPSGDRPNRFSQDRPSWNNQERGSQDRPNWNNRSRENSWNNQDGGVGGINRRPRIKRSADYDPNAKYSQKKQLEYRRNDIDPTKPVRLNKFLANAGICSRREADEFIKAGVISVNGEIQSEMGVKVLPTDKVLFHNQLVRSERKVYLLLNKPKDTVTTAEDTHDRRTVLDLVKNACSERIYPVGRLDRNTTGVLLLTNDGDLASRLTHPKYDKKKIYHAALDKPLEVKDFEQILAGVKLEDETIAADSLNFVSEDDFRQIGIEIHSGQNRVVRRIFESLGYKVVKLDRVYFAGLTKKNLPRGKYRFLSEREVNMLKMGAYE